MHILEGFKGALKDFLDCLAPVSAKPEQLQSVPAPPYFFVRPKTADGIDVQAAADEFYREFPEQQGKVFILGAIRHLGNSPSAADKMNAAVTKIINDNKDFFTEGAGVCYWDESEKNTPYYETKLSLVQLGQNPINLKTEFYQDKFTVVRVTKNVYEHTNYTKQFISDHELGHALCSHGTPWNTVLHKDFSNLGECQADAYAMIRHLQRYGADSPFPQKYAEFRTARAIHGDLNHWTARAIEQVIELNRKGAIKDLTPHQSRDLAIQIAEKAALSHDEMHALGQIIMKAPFDEGLYKYAMDRHWHGLHSLSENCGKIAQKMKSPVTHSLIGRYLDIIEKYGIFPEKEVQKARQKMAETPPDAVEKPRPLRQRLYQQWTGRKLDKTPVPHAALSKPKGPVG